MEEITLQMRDNVKMEILDLVRIETGSRKIGKLPPGFYGKLQRVLVQIKEEKDARLAESEISEYIALNMQEKDIQSNFKALFEKRFEKLAGMSIYNLSEDILSRMTQEEKAAYTEYRFVTERYFRILTEGEI